jgi:hypothetical protein
MRKPFPYLVPTSTVIALHPDNPFLVCVIEQVVKHAGRLTLVGGRREMHHHSHIQTARAEWKEEAGGKGARLTNVRLWAVKTDEHTDVREVTLGKVTFDRCPQAMRAQLVTAHYCAPDYIYLATVKGEPHPSDGEASRCVFIDVREIATPTPDQAHSKFGAQHDLILLVYLLSLLGRPVEVTDFADFTQLRSKLIKLVGDLRSPTSVIDSTI